MRYAIHLDSKPSLRTVEVQDIGLDWMLPPELEAARPLAKLRP